MGIKTGQLTHDFRQMGLAFYPVFDDFHIVIDRLNGHIERLIKFRHFI
jgi:hypothetical protein